MERVGVLRSYVDALTAVDAIAVPLPVQAPELIIEAMSGVDGVLLAGGEDVGDPRVGNCVDCERDALEFLVTKFAVENGMPILGICRGMQLINVVMGGTNAPLEEFARSGMVCHRTDWAAGANYGHWVSLSQGTLLADIFGEERVLVNGVHSRCVATLGTGLYAAAHSDDGIVEAIEADDDVFCLGVQWHPEALVDVGDRHAIALFRRFIESSR